MITPLSIDNNIEDVWNHIQKTASFSLPFSAYAWHRNWFETMGAKWQPMTLLINDTLIAPFARKGDLVIFSGGKEESDYLDIIGIDSDKASYWPMIADYLSHQGIKRLHLSNVPHSSPTVSFFSSFQNATISQEDTTPLMELPSSWDEFVASLKRHDRHELKRKIRKFEASHPAASLVWGSDPNQDIPELFRLMRLNPQKAIFLHSKMASFFTKNLTDFWKRLWLLFIEEKGEKIASVVAFKTSDEILLYNSGFDEDAYSGSGFYLNAMSVKLAIEKGFKRYNFLQGRERYKYDLGGKDFFVSTVQVTID